MASVRDGIAWFGRAPTDEEREHATQRGLQIFFPVPDAGTVFPRCRSVVFCVGDSDFAEVAEALKTNLGSAVDHGLWPQAVVNYSSQLDELMSIGRAVLEVEPVTAHMTFRTGAPSPHELAQRAASHKPGPAPNRSLDIRLPAGTVLSPVQALLLQRAFADCHEVELELLTGGLSGAKTFIVKATLIDTQFRNLKPRPYFVKLHSTGRLRDELKQFTTFAHHHIDWYLRPNFQLDQSIFGARDALLVGSFVSDSQSLINAVKLRGEGRTLILALFNETLAGLRNEDADRSHHPSGSVLDVLASLVDRAKIPKDREDFARATWSGASDREALWLKLLSLRPTQWRLCAAHGDLHVENVRVRKEDAIVLDFAHANFGPMSRDVASLEVSIAFTVCEDSEQFAVWLERAEAWFDPGNVVASLKSGKLPLSAGWMGDCISTLREIASQSVFSPKEYLLVLAVHLLRHSTYPSLHPRPDECELRRAAAYCFASRIAEYLCSADRVAAAA